MLEGYLPDIIIKIVNSFVKIEEIRIRLGKPLVIISNSNEYFFDKVDAGLLGQTIKMLTSYSVYAIRNNLKNGFITIKGGHRVGFSGTCVIKNNEIYHMRDINSINIRIAKEHIGVSDEVFKTIKNNINNLLIISPPGCGKTTYLRDLSRNFSCEGYNVSVVDERGEIFPYNEKGSIFDNGYRCDVLSYCPKTEGITMMLRVMNPMIIVCDEISSREDSYAIESAAASGVYVIASMHGYSIDDYMKRPEFSSIVKNNVFSYFLLLSNEKGVGTIKDLIKL